jgi:hypothetical protein
MKGMKLLFQGNLLKRNSLNKSINLNQIDCHVLVNLHKHLIYLREIEFHMELRNWDTKEGRNLQRE